MTINGKEYMVKKNFKIDELLSDSEISSAVLKMLIDKGYIAEAKSSKMIQLGFDFYLEDKDSDYIVCRTLVGPDKYAWVAMSLNTGKALVDPKVFGPKAKMEITMDEFKKLLGKRAAKAAELVE